MRLLSYGCISFLLLTHYTFFFFFFFFNDTATTEIYTLSLHDALPICRAPRAGAPRAAREDAAGVAGRRHALLPRRSEEHTSELQSRLHLVCRLLLEKKKKKEISTGLTNTEDAMICELGYR